jgi:hypothetical protein
MRSGMVVVAERLVTSSTGMIADDKPTYQD